MVDRRGAPVLYVHEGQTVHETGSAQRPSVEVPGLSNMLIYVCVLVKVVVKKKKPKNQGGSVSTTS